MTDYDCDAAPPADHPNWTCSYPKGHTGQHRHAHKDAKKWGTVVATKYRRLTYRDYDGSALVTALDSSIRSSWQAMQQERKSAKELGDGSFLYEHHRRMARVFAAILREVLYIRRCARES